MPDVIPSFSLAGKVIVQSGGTGLLGRALVAGLAGCGATVVVASRDPGKVGTATAGKAGAVGGVHADQVDLGDEGSILALRDRVLAAHGRIDGLVFNAVSRPMRSMSDSLSAWKASMDTNATGFFAIVRAFADAIARTGGGSIVNIASMQGIVGVNPSLYEGTTMTAAPDYFFHKGGMINLTRYLASHYGAQRVRVNAVSPGGIYNPERPPPAVFLERYGRMTMLGRMADAHEVTGAVVFLLSDASTYITSANLVVDGGYTAK